ncbi:MAG: replicative DNA helicase [Candidatus Pelagibacter sp.]|nr:replicative DNA helicase [Candidatus Pelagibacter sp.]OUV87396.1 MAG: replicative DNA helicase [Pelagibacteraceae bacterium TMED136]|tara:strand:- start:11028 stop:12452 length:1425 start_codon:yes stop_codon:yes gene_type:complete
MSSSLVNLDISKDSQIPKNVEAEQTILGSLLANNEIFDEITDQLDENYFFDPIHQKIFKIISNLISKGLLANPVTIKNFFNSKDELIEIGGVDYLIKLTKVSTTKNQIKYYSQLLSDLYIRRQLINISEETLEESKNKDLEISGTNILENTERKLFEIAERGEFQRSFMTFKDALKETIDMATAAYKNDQGIVGVPSGLTDLDDRLGGLHKQDLVIIAGRPSMGKTALATNIAFNASLNLQKNDLKASVAFFSLEMSSEQLSTRILAEQSRIKSNDIRRGKINQDDFERFIEASKNLEMLPLHIDDTPAITISALSNRARRLKRKEGLDLIVVDYIQLMKSSGYRNEGRVLEIAEITQGLKALAKELDVPVIALSQLSRQVEQREDKKPQLSDLRESGSIEQDADVVMFVFREQYYLEKQEPKPGTAEHVEWQEKMSLIHNQAEIIIGKQRHGPTGVIKLEFESAFTKFKDATN